MFKIFSVLSCNSCATLLPLLLIMKKHFTHFFFSLCVFSYLCMSSCATTSSPAATLDTLYAPSYAQHFVVLQHGDSTVLRVKNPWQGAQDVTYDYVFARSPQRMVTMSTSHSAFLEALGKGANIVGASSPQYLWSNELRKLPDVGFDNGLNYETIVGLEPDAYFTYEISGENSSATQKLRSLGINVILIADYLENSPLGKAEWIVAFGAATGDMDKALEIFHDVEDNYTQTKEVIATHLGQLDGKRPRAMLNSPYKDVWYLPGDSTYMVRLLEDAGAEYVAKGVSDNISRATSMEKAYSLLQQADVWLNLSADISKIEQIHAINPLLEKTSIPIYNNTLRNSDAGGSDFWESGVLRCDIILRDLATILYPELPLNHTLYYYREIER